MPRVDLIGTVEVIYRVEETSSPAWLRGVIDEALSLVGRGHRGAYALEYDASDPRAIRFSNTVMSGVDDRPLRRLLEIDCPQAYYDHPDLVEAVFRQTGHARSRMLPMGQYLVAIHEKLRKRGVHEILGVNGLNLDGRGAHFGVLLSRPAKRFGDDTLARVSSHLAAAFRLRRRLAKKSFVESADAVIEPGGKIAHAERDAKLKSARDALRDAVVVLDRLRAGPRRRDPERALRAWRALVDTRWSLIDHFDRDGKRYVLAERNDAVPAPTALLSSRERQVVALAAVGHANKMIAYELGISVSTVGVLLTRAARRVGAKSRRELIQTYRRDARDSADG